MGRFVLFTAVAFILVYAVFGDVDADADMEILCDRN